MDGIAIVPKKPKIDWDHLPKHRRDWLEVFGNQWGSRRFAPEDTRMTAEEKQALAIALNPFAR